MKKILVPCDFSKPAINAYRFALDVAAKANGTVHLLHVVELPVLYDTVLMPALNFEQALLNELKEKTETEFEKIIGKYPSEGVKVFANVVFGSPSKVILEYTKNESIDLIVMGSHGVSGLREIFVGSNAERIVRSSSVPVLVIKHYYKGPVKNIVFPTDLGTEEQEDLILKVKELQNFFKAHLHLVWINTPLNFTSDTITHERLDAFAKRIKLKDYTINIFNHPTEEEGIISFTKLIKGDLIAMSTHGRKGIAHLINGSVTEDVANHTESLIWTYSLKNEPAFA
jgi:nucleotide-binding universal stress UspA family protein